MSKHSTDLFCPPIPFGNRWIGPGFPVFVIAEIGINHEGDPDRDNGAGPQSARFLHGGGDTGDALFGIAGV